MSNAPVELGTKKIGSLLKEYAIPGIIAMTASSLYNMVDSIYIGHIPGDGALALTALGVCFPLMNLGTAIGTLAGVGISTLTSILLGQKNYTTANKLLPNLVTLNVVLGGLYTILTLLFMDPLLRFFGATDATIGFARSYMIVISLGFIVTHLYFGMNALLRSTGHPERAMALTLFTVIFNAVLDPLFIFVFGMGVQGAAIATVICQAISLAYCIWYFSGDRNIVHFGRRIFGFSWKLARTTLGIGMGPFLMNSAACLVNMFFNQQLLKYGGDYAIGAYGIINRFSFLFFMIVLGINQGMQPIASYNFGARNGMRVRAVYLLSIAWATAVMSVGFIFSEFFPHLACSIFTNDEEMLGIAVHGMRIINLALPVIGFQIISTNLFQCLGMVKQSIFLSLSRQLIFLLPCLYALPLALNIEGVWLSYPVSDVIAFVVTTIMVVRLIKKLKRIDAGETELA